MKMTFRKSPVTILVAILAFFASGAAMALTVPAAAATDPLYLAVVTNLLSGGVITWVIAVGLSIFAIFQLFRAWYVALIAVAAAIFIMNPESILTSMGYII